VLQSQPDARHNLSWTESYRTCALHQHERSRHGHRTHTTRGRILPSRGGARSLVVILRLSRTCRSSERLTALLFLPPGSPLLSPHKQHIIVPWRCRSPRCRATSPGLRGLQEPGVTRAVARHGWWGGKRPGGAGFFAEAAWEQEDEVEGQGFTMRRRGKPSSQQPNSMGGWCMRIDWHGTLQTTRRLDAFPPSCLTDETITTPPRSKLTD